MARRAPGVVRTPELGKALERLEPYARENWPDTFGGLWVDEHLDEKQNSILTSVQIAFTNDANRNLRTIAQEFPEPRLLRAVTVEKSFRELEKIQKEMIADREEAKESGGSTSALSSGRYNLDIDLERNAVTMTVEDASPDLRAEVKREYGADIVIEQGPLGGPKACLSRINCAPDLRAGLYVESADFSCTSAFAVRRPNGLRKLMSAGHCPQTNRWHADLFYGSVESQQVAGRVDAEWHGVGAGFNAVPRTYVNVDNKNVAVRTRTSWQGLVVGTRACKSGAITGKYCGSIMGKSFSPHWIPNSFQFVRVNNCAEGGDSGSPLYDNANWGKVHGILSGGTVSRCPDSNQWNAYGHIEFALNALNVTLMIVP